MSLSSRQGLKTKNGSRLMMKNSQTDTIRTQAIDRKHSKSGMQNGTTALKARHNDDFAVLQDILVDLKTDQKTRKTKIS